LVKRRVLFTLASTAVLAGVVATPLAGATAVTSVRISATVPASLADNLPLLRLHFSVPTKARSLPPLRTKPALHVQWQQIGPTTVQAVVTSSLAPATSYTIAEPTQMRCAKTCTFTAFRPQVASVATDLTWEAQLLAELHYLPLTFTPGTAQTSPSEQVNGAFTWEYPNLPVSLSSQWVLGTDNVILTAALKTFQSQRNLPVTGDVDPTTWSDLVAAANNNAVDPATYDYVDVNENVGVVTNETLTLYVAGKAIFSTPVNTGIEPVPTTLGTFAVYERFVTTTMSGKNPDGTTYHDPDIPWVSYFNGGDALHGFIRAQYGFPQSLGCVEMPFAAAKTIFPYTPIGTLVTVRA
jgi:lipoprotein-anchoring transpeptidase ErfK/SrfK